jgi:hypothetical protein
MQSEPRISLRPGDALKRTLGAAKAPYRFLGTDQAIDLLAKSAALNAGRF